jgi:hypothetical protein
MQATLYVTILLSAALSGAMGYLTSRLSQRSQTLIDRQTYRGAMLAEIRGLHRRLLEYETAFAERVMTGQISSAQVLRVLLQPGDTAVFNNHASSIGLFDRRTALRVVRFYATIRSLEGRALVLAKTAEDTGYNPRRRQPATAPRVRPASAPPRSPAHPPTPPSPAGACRHPSHLDAVTR